MFLIKPSRIPQNLNSPRRTGGTYNENALQKLRQALQPYEVPAVDDRRRLPSYTRGATSEVISMCEPASQKSGSRVFGDPDYRSYSMTQQSPQASYMLSPHRSYTSFRSQTDSSGFLQRPRSLFAYPTRLKRPGFRPSSPALTDRGVVDYWDSATDSHNLETWSTFFSVAAYLSFFDDLANSFMLLEMPTYMDSCLAKRLIARKKA